MGPGDTDSWKKLEVENLVSDYLLPFLHFPKAEDDMSAFNALLIIFSFSNLRFTTCADKPCILS